jgi:hypothetical protein
LTIDKGRFPAQRPGLDLVAPRGGTATIGGIMNLLNNVMGVVAPITTGYIVGGTASFTGAFLVPASRWSSRPGSGRDRAGLVRRRSKCFRLDDGVHHYQSCLCGVDDHLQRLDKSDATGSAKGGSRVKNLAEKIAAMWAKAQLTRASSVPRGSWRPSASDFAISRNWRRISRLDMA